MLRHGIKLVGAVLVAVLASSAMYVASASAVELIKFSKIGNFTAKSVGVMKLETSAGRVFECQTATFKGKVETEVLALMLALFEKCTSGGATCTSAGSPSGEIHVPHLLVLLGSDEAPPNDNPAVLMLPSNPSTGAEEPIKFKCGNILESTFTIKGSVICLIKNDSTKAKLELLCEKGAKVGEQKDKKFWDKNQANVEDFLKTTAEGAEKFAEIESALIGTVLVEGEGVVIQVEV